MGKIIDLTGERFGRLTVMYRTDDKIGKDGTRHVVWHCVCDCGNEKDIRYFNLIYGHTQSCGCIHRESTIRRNKENIKSNTYDVIENFIVVHTNKNDFIIDKDDEWVLKDYCWYISSKGYVVAKQRGVANSHIFLHRTIMKCDEDMFVDHIDGDKLNNKKSNLRICTKSQNCMNIGLKSNNTSGYTGVTYLKKQDTWLAYINVDGKRINLCYTKNKDDAILARIDAELKYHGDYSGVLSRHLHNNLALENL